MATKKSTVADAETTATQTEAQPKADATPAKVKKLTLAQKILAVKNTVGKVVKDGTGKVGSEQKGNAKEIKYATLTNVLEKLTPALAEYGVDYVVAPVWSELAVSMLQSGFRFFSIHLVDAETGETSEPVIYPFRLAINPDPIKADGSTFTYVTRYLLGLVFGIQTEMDPDAKEQKPPKQQQPQQQQPQQPQPQKVRTFRECVSGFYATYNRGDLGGAKRTLEFVRKNWGHDENCAVEIAAMEQVDLTVWVPLEKKEETSAPAPAAPPEPPATPTE